MSIHSFVFVLFIMFISFFFFFFFNDPATPEIYPLPLHDALPISRRSGGRFRAARCRGRAPEGKRAGLRSEEHTSELQSPCNLVCRLLLEKKKKKKPYVYQNTTREAN